MAITIYTTPSCGYCKVAKEFFKAEHIPYTEYNVASDQRKAEEMVRKSHQMGVPVIDVNGKIIVGFNKPEIVKALRR